MADKVDQLFIEAVFLERDRHLAEASFHLTAWEAGALAREAGVRYVTPFHYSARYLAEPDLLRQEVFETFRTGEARSLIA